MTEGLRLKTAQEVVDDFIAFLKGSALAEAITGDVYPMGERPDDPDAENAFVSFLSGEDTLLQQGYVNCNVYVHDIIPDNGPAVVDKARVAAVMTALRAFRDDFPCTDGYQILTDTTDTVEKEPGIQAHYVHTRFRFARRAS